MDSKRGMRKRTSLAVKKAFKFLDIEKCEELIYKNEIAGALEVVKEIIDRR